MATRLPELSEDRFSRTLRKAWAADSWERLAFPQYGCTVYGAAFTAAEAPGLLEGFQAQCDERHAMLLLHGDPTNPSSPYNPITAAQVREAGVDYAALGHIHAQGRFEAGAGICAWPGCAMGRGFDETGTKGVLIAEVEEKIVKAKRDIADTIAKIKLIDDGE